MKKMVGGIDVDINYFTRFCMGIASLNELKVAIKRKEC